jgi:hypothetical protein
MVALLSKKQFLALSRQLSVLRLVFRFDLEVFPTSSPSRKPRARVQADGWRLRADDRNLRSFNHGLLVAVSSWAPGKRDSDDTPEDEFFDQQGRGKRESEASDYDQTLQQSFHDRLLIVRVGRSVQDANC